MYDLSQPNDKPGTCIKCKGTGVYGWGAIARAWREGREFGHNVTAVWAEAV